MPATPLEYVGPRRLELEHVAQRELNLTAAIAHVGDPAERRRTPRRRGVLERGRIRHVEELRTELDALAFADVEVLEDREVHLDPARPVQVGLPDLAERAVGGRLEGGGVELQLLEVVVADDRVGSRHRVGPHGPAAAAVADLRRDRERISALGEENPDRLPAAEDDLRRAGHVLAPRQLPDPARHEALRDVELRESPLEGAVVDVAEALTR